MLIRSRSATARGSSSCQPKRLHGFPLPTPMTPTTGPRVQAHRFSAHRPRSSVYAIGAELRPYYTPAAWLSVAEAWDRARAGRGTGYGQGGCGAGCNADDRIDCLRLGEESSPMGEQLPLAARTGLACSLLGSFLFNTPKEDNWRNDHAGQVRSIRGGHDELRRRDIGTNLKASSWTSSAAFLALIASVALNHASRSSLSFVGRPAKPAFLPELTSAVAAGDIMSGAANAVWNKIEPFFSPPL